MVFTGIWVLASLLKSSELFLVFWLISTLLEFGLILFTLREFFFSYISSSRWSFTSHQYPSQYSDLSNVVWIVSTRLLISKSSIPCTSPLVTVRTVVITIGITVTFMFHSFFQSPSKVQVLILLFAFFQFYSVVSWDSKVHNSASFLSDFLLSIIRSDRLAIIIG